MVYNVLSCDRNQAIFCPLEGLQEKVTKELAPKLHQLEFEKFIDAEALNAEIEEK